MSGFYSPFSPAFNSPFNTPFKTVAGLASGGSAFDPLVDADLAGLWVALDATDNGTTITVPDRSVNGYNMTATGSDRPAISSTGFCNHKGLTSDQGTWKGVSSSAIGAALSGGQQISIVCLLGNVTDPGSTRPFIKYGTGYAGCFDLDVKYTGRGQLRANFIQAGGVTSCELKTIADSEVLTVPKTVAVTFNGSLGADQVRAYYQDGQLIPSAYANNGINACTFPNDTLNIANGFDGVFAGCAVVKRVLTQSEVLQFSNYLRGAYGMGDPKQVLWVGDSLTNPSQLSRVGAAYATDRAATPSLWGTYEAIDHAGVAGETISQIQTRLTTQLASGTARQPTHILLFNCGTNDFLQGATAAQLASRWEALLAHVYSLRPGVPIKLSSLVKNTASAGAFTQIVIDANTLGPSAVANAVAANPGMDAEWITNAYDIPLQDGTHPTQGVGSGEDDIAAVLWPQIKTW